MKHHFKLRHLLFLILTLTTFSAWADEDCYIKRHALYDIGSGSTKLTVVETNTCEKKHKTILATSEKVDYKDDLIKNNNSQFSPEIQKTGLEALKKLKTEAEKLNATIHQGIATAAFREATNAPAVVEKIKQLGILINIVTQEEEGLLDYEVVQASYPDLKPLVWDIGGASFQITGYDKKIKKLNIFKGQLASVVFKDLILKEIKKKATSVSPLSKTEIKKSRQLVIKKISKELKNSYVVKNKYKKAFGLGGILAVSFKRHLDKTIYTAKDIDLWIEQNHFKTEEELHDKYAYTILSNMILVSEMMKILKIQTIEALDVAPVESLLPTNL